ncbi:hypothetical protein Bca52824_001777 [Brassica carinata]|uniref:TPX2 C-terminal domain-containing protein n=1 Tax=Brassica carinata TaxID=52824 RepID=A0A8X8BE90_BRACI|nr:hypothetical protein Bca52824_001777 [Brassica carinata]
MGREPEDKHMDNKLNSSSGSSSQQIEAADVKECTTDHNLVADDGSGSHTSSGQRKKLNTPSPSRKTRGVNYTVPKPFSLSAEKPASSSICARAGVDSPNNNNNSPGNAVSRNSSSGSQTNSPMPARKTVNHMKHRDDEDTFSVASSSATSVRTIKPKVTIGVAPTFSSTSRLERRREFYKKLEEKQKALEEEKKENEKRLKEEQEIATKQLRKNMAYKANPVPTFYHEPPPQKPPLKKFPLTRPKSPNLNRRKSCSDTVNSSHQEVKGKHCARHRHSVDGRREESKASDNPRRTPDMKKSAKETPKSEEVYLKNKNGHEGEGEVGENCIEAVE